MALVTELDLPVLDYSDPTLKGTRFHDVMREHAAQGWLSAGPLGVCVLDRESCEFFLRTKAAEFPGQKLAEIFGIDDGPLREEIDRNILHINGPQHSRLRHLVNPAFTPRAADRWRPAMRSFLEELWSAVAADGRCDFVEAFAKPYPSQVIATVMGAPLADAPRLHEWSNWIQRQFDGPSLLADRARIEQAVEEFYVWAGELLESKRAAAGKADDLVSTLLEAEAEGDRLSDVETLHLVLNVLIGGVDTTQSQLAQAIRLLAADPEQWALLHSDPETYAPRAVDEVLRFEPITPFTARITTEEVVFRDVTFPEGTVVMVASFAANRDGVDGPDAFDLRADRGRARPLTFGAGVHFCLGSNLARAEMEEGLRFLGEHIAELELDGEPQLGTVQGIYGLDALPVRFTT